MNEQQLRMLINEKINNIDSVKLYYEIYKYEKVLVRKQATIETIKLCIAYSEIGMPITCNTIKWFNKKHKSTVNYALHILGDKKILLYKRDGKLKLTYVLMPKFKEMFVNA